MTSTKDTNIQLLPVAEACYASAKDMAKHKVSMPIQPSPQAGKMKLPGGGHRVNASTLAIGQPPIPSGQQPVFTSLGEDDPSPPHTWFSNARPPMTRVSPASTMPRPAQPISAPASQAMPNAAPQPMPGTQETTADLTTARDAAVKFIEVASPKTQEAVGNVGMQLARTGGIQCTTPAEGVVHAFEVAAQNRETTIKNPILKKFINAINNFIDKFVEQSKSVVNGVKEAIGSFASKLLSGEGRSNSQSRSTS